MAAICWDLKPQQRVTSLQKGDNNPPANLRTVQTGKIGGGVFVEGAGTGEREIFCGLGMISYKIMHNCPQACLAVQSNRLFC